MQFRVTLRLPDQLWLRLYLLTRVVGLGARALFLPAAASGCGGCAQTAETGRRILIGRLLPAFAGIVG